MGRKTYAYNSIIIGFVIGFTVWASTRSILLAILAGLGIAVVGFIIIRVIENALYKGVDKAVDKISDAHQRRKAAAAQKMGQTQSLASRYTGNASLSRSSNSDAAEENRR